MHTLPRCGAYLGFSRSGILKRCTLLAALRTLVLYLRAERVSAILLATFRCSAALLPTSVYLGGRDYELSRGYSSRETAETEEQSIQADADGDDGSEYTKGTSQAVQKPTKPQTAR